MGYYEMNLQRKEAIEEGLLALMETVPYAQISVKDLTERLQLARKTFYHYFPNKQACLESLTDRLIYACNLNVLQTLPEKATAEQVHAARLQFWTEHRNFLEAVNRNGLASFLLDRFLRYLNREDAALRQKLNTPHVEVDEDILFFYMSGQLALLLKWCSEGFILPVEDMARKSLRLLYEPLLAPETEA